MQHSINMANDFLTQVPLSLKHIFNTAEIMTRKNVRAPRSGSPFVNTLKTAHIQKGKAMNIVVTERSLDGLLVKNQLRPSLFQFSMCCFGYCHVYCHCADRQNN